MNLFDQRLEVCSACPNYREALGAGVCVLIRDSSLRVSSELLRLALERGTWPQSGDNETACNQPGQEFNRRRQ